MGSIINHYDCDYNGFEAIFKDLSLKYPFIKVLNIGKTVLGRSIKALSIGNTKNTVLYTAAIHGSERLTAAILMKFFEELCDALYLGKPLAGVDIGRVLYGKGAVFVPVCNPDGCEIALKGDKGAIRYSDKIKRLCQGDFEHWNANARGVDLNHNFDAGWERLHKAEREAGYFGPGPTRFGGSFPRSEPETDALCRLCEELDFRYVICLHSQGEVIYWDYDGIDTLRGRKMAEIFAASSRYALEAPTGIATGGGLKDWFIEKFRRPGFTVELGKGKNPIPWSSGEEIYERVKEMLTLSLIM